MQITNNYNLGVFNGEVGEIQWTSETTEGVKVSVDFGNKQIIYTNENLYELCWHMQLCINHRVQSLMPL